jgi:hypothetical protein
MIDVRESGENESFSSPSDAFRSTHFKNVGLQFTIDEDVEAENLETRTATVMIRETRPIVVLQDRLSRKKNFDDHVVDVCPQFDDIVAVLDEPTVDRGDTTRIGMARCKAPSCCSPFHARVLVANEIFGSLLYRVVR